MDIAQLKSGDRPRSNAMSKVAVSFVASLCLFSLLASQPDAQTGDKFTIAVIPDTQNYVDYWQQKAAGFPLDAKELFFEQMKYVAANAQSQGGDIVFSTGVGDMWQHFSLEINPAHAALNAL